MIKMKSILSALLFLLVSSAYCQQFISATEFKDALEQLGESVKNGLIGLENPSNDYRIYENSQKVSLTDFRFLKEKKVFQAFILQGIKEREYIERYAVLLGALKSLKDNEEVLLQLKANFSEYKAIIDACGCIQDNQGMDLFKIDQEVYFESLWNCNDLGQLHLRYSYNEIFGIYFAELIIDYRKFGPR